MLFRSRAATATVTVDNVYVLAIGTPGAGGAHFTSMAGGQLRMKRGAHLQLPNTDTIAHRIHSDAALPGFPHQPASMGPGGVMSSSWHRYWMNMLPVLCSSAISAGINPPACIWENSL